MPLYPDYLYGGNSSSFSSPYYSHASSSSSPPSSPYSRVGTHWPIIGYSPLTALLSANISSLNTTPRRSYAPYLSSISEKSPALGRHLFTNRHSPKSKLLYFKSRPVTINTENINLSKDNLKEKKDSVSMSGPIQRGKTVVRMHTKKLKENPGLKKVKKTPGAMLMEKFLIKEPPKEDPYNWREEYNNKKNQLAAKNVSPVRFVSEEEEKVSLNKDEPTMVVDEEVLPLKVEENVSRLNNAPVVSSSTQQRRMSITDERLQEEAAILDSLIQEEMKEGQKMKEVRRRRKSADLLEEDSSPVLTDNDTSVKKAGKKKYVRQPSGERSSRTLPLDLVESSDGKTNDEEDSKKVVRKRPTVKRKNPLKIVVNEITVEEKVEPPKVPRKLNYEVIVEEGKDDDLSEEVVTKVLPRPRPSLAIKRRPTIKRMFSRDKEALAARTETATQEPKTEKPSDSCSNPSENQEDTPPPVMYRSEFFLKGEDPILEEPRADAEIKDHIRTPPPVEASQPKIRQTKFDNKLSESVEKSNIEQITSKPLSKLPFSKDNQQQKVPGGINNKLSSIPSNGKSNKDLSGLKPLSKFPFSKDTKQEDVSQSTKSSAEDLKLKNELGKDLKSVEKSQENECTVMEKTGDTSKEKKKIEAPQNSSVIDEKSVIPPMECANNVESPPPVTFRTEFVLWGSPNKDDQIGNDETTEIKETDTKCWSNLKLTTTDEIGSVNKEQSVINMKTKEISEEKQKNELQKQKLGSSTSIPVNKISDIKVSKIQPKILEDSKNANSCDQKISKSVTSEEKQSTIPNQDKRKQSIFGDILVKNDNIKIFGIQVKSDDNVPPKVDQSKTDLKSPAATKPSDLKNTENQNGVKKLEKTVIPQFLNRNKIEADSKKFGDESKIQKKDESGSSFLSKKNVIESKPQGFNKISDVQRKEKSTDVSLTDVKSMMLTSTDVSLMKNESSSTETLPVDKVQKLLPNKNISLTKTDCLLQTNSIQKSATLVDSKAVKTINEKKVLGNTKEELLHKSEDINSTSQQVKSSLAPSFPSQISKQTVDDNKIDEKFSKNFSIHEKSTMSVQDRSKAETTAAKVGINEKSKMTKSVEETKPTAFGMKKSLEKIQLEKCFTEKVKPNLKVMNGGELLSTSLDGVSIEKHLSTDLPIEGSSVNDGTNKEEEKVTSPKSTSVSKVKKDSSKKVTSKTKDRSDSETKVVSRPTLGTKKGSKDTNKETLTKDNSVSSSGDGLETEKLAVKRFGEDEKLEETSVISGFSRNSDNLAEKKTKIGKSGAVSEKTDGKSNSKQGEKKTDLAKTGDTMQKKDVNSSGKLEKETTTRKSSVVSEESLIEEGRMTVRRRMTKHKTNLSETRMSLMKFEEKKRKEAEVKQDEKKMSKENGVKQSGKENCVKKSGKENCLKQSGKQSSKLLSDSPDDVEVKVVPVNNKITKESDEDGKKEDGDEDGDTETEGGSSSEEEEESTEVESSSEYESDGSAESRERSSGSPLRHLSDSSLGLGGLDEVTTTEVSRCRVTPPATTLPRFRKYSIQDFQFLKVLGKGSFGKVLLAELIGTECYYAVKCLKKDVVLEDDDVECTLIERKVLALGTNHPYLCHLFCTFQTESHLFFVMEYLNGGDLMFHIQQSGRFDEGRARFYASEIVSGLMFLHKKGIVYRDLKLDNILLDFDGHVRIADFGMCKLQIYLDRTADTFCGTPDYMAPEIIKGLAYNQCVDWWSFGILLYEMLVGQSPFSGCDEDDLFWSICNEQPHYPRFLSKESKLILSQLLEKDSSRRLGSSELSGREVTSHVFFRDWDWFRLERRQLDPPFKPRVRHPLDVQYFDKAFTNERPRLTPIDKSILQSMDQTQFQGFSYTNPNVTK